MTDDNPWFGEQLWVIRSQYDSLVFYLTKDQALDRLTRTDKLYSCRLTDWREEE